MAHLLWVDRKGKSSTTVARPTEHDDDDVLTKGSRPTRLQRTYILATQTLAGMLDSFPVLSHTAWCDGNASLRTSMLKVR